MPFSGRWTRVTSPPRRFTASRQSQATPGTPLEHYAAPFISTGALVRVLEGWCAPFPGYFLYYPSRRHPPAALTALIKTLRLTG